MTILAFGCSQTFGDGLPDTPKNLGEKRTSPSQYSWPAKLGSILSDEVINYGFCGASIKTIANLSILKTKEFIDKNLSTNLKVFILWGYLNRGTIGYNINLTKENLNIYPDNLDHFTPLALDKQYKDYVKKQTRDIIETYYMYLHSELEDCLDSYLKIVSVCNWLEINNIEYKMMFVERTTYNSLNFLQQKYNLLDNKNFAWIEFDKQYFPDELVNYNDKYKFAIDGKHIGEEIHEEIAKTFYKSL